MLKNGNGDWEEDQSILKNMGVEFFKNLYSEDSIYDQFLIRGAFSELSLEDNQSLARDIADAKVRSMIFSLGWWKAPSPDGLPAIFY